MVSKILTFLLILASAAFAADYTLPAANQWDWTVGTKVGVIGGIDQYQPGGANARTNIIDVTASPYNANLANPSTTGTVAASSASLTVASPTGFRSGDFIIIDGGWPEFSQMVVTSGASADGNVGVYIGGYTVDVAILSTDSATQAATKIRAATYAGWTTGGSGTTVTWTATTNGNAYLTLLQAYAPAREVRGGSIVNTFPEIPVI